MKIEKCKVNGERGEEELGQQQLNLYKNEEDFYLLFSGADERDDVVGRDRSMDRRESAGRSR